MRGMRLAAAAAWAATAFWGSSAGAAPMYNVTSLGPGQPIGIDDQGRVGVTALSSVANAGFDTARSYFFNPSAADVYQSLGPTAGSFTPSSGGAPVPGVTTPWVNDSGDYAATEAVDGRIQPYVVVGGVKTPIPTDDNALMDPKAINASGQVVGEGYVRGSDPGYHAFLFDNGTLHDLGTLGGRASQAEAVNDQGVVVGWAMVANPNSDHADGEIHAFVYDGSMRDLSSVLGPGYSHAYGVNSAGAIVGDWSAAYGGPTNAVLIQGDTATDLNSLLPADSPWRLETALGINDLGQIVGIGSYDGWERAFLLTPSALGRPPDVQAVPEPGMLALFGLGIVGVAVGRRRDPGRLRRA